MTTFTNYVFSKAAASRILEKKVISVKVEGDRVKCQLWDKTYRTITTTKIKQHFAEYRREQGKKLEPKRNFFTCEWYVNGYTVGVRPDRLSCNCKDWQIQSAIGIKRPTCKHCYSVLNKLGCNSLAEYLEKTEARSSVKATNQKTEDSHQTPSSVAPSLPKINRWEWKWETYARDRAGNPIKTATTYSTRYPTEKEITENRRFNHSKGFRLVAIEQEQAVAS